MITFSLFIFSGAAIATLTLAKRREEKRKQPVLILRAISRGDERVRGYHHWALDWYTLGKDQAGFWFKKQLTLKAKSLWNRFISWNKGMVSQYMGDMRDARLLKRSEGISEFFKSISEVEKGLGEINETLDETIAEGYYPLPSVTEIRRVEEPKTAVSAPKVSKPARTRKVALSASPVKKKRAPSRRKVKVLEATNA